jgi:hypothetical protein
VRFEVERRTDPARLTIPAATIVRRFGPVGPLVFLNQELSVYSGVDVVPWKRVPVIETPVSVLRRVKACPTEGF